MADIHAEYDFDKRTLRLKTLSLLLPVPQPPDEITVRNVDGRNRDVYSARVLIYKPERTARRIAVFSEGTDFTVGHTECSECRESINPCAAFCEHCGARFEVDE
jgi:hypothetical protein